ncbi:hypothetical protein NQ314_012101, partial [Rhamnusium bicolor]
MACIQKAPVAAATVPSPVKKPSIAIVAGASTSEDVCPWEAGPPEPRSRKNSAQLDSGSSSSDISVAVAEVTEKIQRSCMLTQQHTLDGGRKLTANPTDPPRRASVSVPITHSTDSSKRKVSSFEDSSAATSTSSSVFVNPSDTDNKSEEKTMAGANAPIISVSSVVDDLPSDSGDHQEEEEEAEKVKEKTEEIGIVAGYSQEPLAPLAEPDSESPASEFPPSEPGECAEGEGEGEAKSNDVCPWED